MSLRLGFLLVLNVVIGGVSSEQQTGVSLSHYNFQSEDDLK